MDAEIERQLEETQVIAEMVKTAVKENASTAQSQEAYLKKYEALTERYEKAAAELERLQTERTARTQQDKKIALFIRTFKKLPDTMTEWDDTIWTKKPLSIGTAGLHLCLRTERKSRSERNCTETSKTARPHNFWGERVLRSFFAALGNN